MRPTRGHAPAPSATLNKRNNKERAGQEPKRVVRRPVGWRAAGRRVGGDGRGACTNITPDNWIHLAARDLCNCRRKRTGQRHKAAAACCWEELLECGATSRREALAWRRRVVSLKCVVFWCVAPVSWLPLLLLSPRGQFPHSCASATARGACCSAQRAGAAALRVGQRRRRRRRRVCETRNAADAAALADALAPHKRAQLCEGKVSRTVAHTRRRNLNDAHKTRRGTHSLAPAKHRQRARERARGEANCAHAAEQRTRIESAKSSNNGAASSNTATRARLETLSPPQESSLFAPNDAAADHNLRRQPKRQVSF